MACIAALISSSPPSLTSLLYSFCLSICLITAVVIAPIAIATAPKPVARAASFNAPNAKVNFPIPPDAKGLQALKKSGPKGREAVNQMGFFKNGGLGVSPRKAEAMGMTINKKG